MSGLPGAVGVKGGRVATPAAVWTAGVLVFGERLVSSIVAVIPAVPQAVSSSATVAELDTAAPIFRKSRRLKVAMLYSAKKEIMELRKSSCNTGLCVLVHGYSDQIATKLQFLMNVSIDDIKPEIKAWFCWTNFWNVSIYTERIQSPCLCSFVSYGRVIP